MSKLILVIMLCLLHHLTYGLNITIVSSQPLVTGNNADSIWMEVALNMGHTPIIVPQSTLANQLFFATTDILIISAGTIGLLNGEETIILDFMKTGKPVYIQSEYSPYLTTNKAFQYIVSSLGGDFSWQNIFSYDLGHVNVLGSFSNTFNNVHSLNYYWHSVSGKGDCNTIPFLEHGGEHHGFQYIPKNTDYGSIITTTDQDWIFERTSLELMENIIYHLISPPPIPVENIINLGNDTTLCVGEELILVLTGSPALIEWSDHSNSPLFTVKQEGKYWVKANLVCGDVSDTILVAMNYCDCKLYLPNIFTPDNSGTNDFFQPESNCPISHFIMLIYDRWGNLIFKSKDKFCKWDGTYKGKLSPPGVYTYYIEYEVNELNPSKTYGTLTLLR